VIGLFPRSGFAVDIEKQSKMLVSTHRPLWVEFTANHIIRIAEIQASIQTQE
jgi:hypothetical protein